MKITDRGSISVTLRQASGPELKGLKSGGTVTALLIERKSRFEAVISLGGQKVNARFVNGVPGYTRIPLQLTSKTGSSYTFRILSESLPGPLLESVKNLIVSPGPDLRHFARIDPSAVNTLLALNLIFADNEKPFLPGKRGGAAELLNRMLQMGFEAKDLVVLSWISGSSSAGYRLLALLYAFTGRKQAFSAQEVQDSLNNIIEKTDILNSGDKSRIMADLLSSLAGSAEGENLFDLAVYDEGEFRPAMIIARQDSWYFTAEFSSLGPIEAVIKMVDGKITMSIIFIDSEKKQFFSEAMGELEKSLLARGLDINSISLYSGDELRSLVAEIKSASDADGLFNVRV